MKKNFLRRLDDFLTSLGEKTNGKCYFKLCNGQVYQGWIMDVGENEFTFLDSGLFANEDEISLLIADIDTNSFAYWREDAGVWVDYVG